MKKILFICDGDNYPKGAFQFINELHGQEEVFVKGLFFTPVDFEQMIAVGHMPEGAPYERIKEEERRLVQKSALEFRKQCYDAGIRYEVAKENTGWDKKKFALESRYADFAVISEELFCSELVDIQPNFFMQELLRDSECPVMVIPEKYKSPERLIFACDGKKESVFALKQFTLLFPHLADVPSEFVYANDDPREEFPDESLLKEYVMWHYDSLGSTTLHFDPKKYMTTWLENKKDVMLVTGSYSRSGVSNLLKPSFSDQVIRKHEHPVFIAHL